MKRYIHIVICLFFILGCKSQKSDIKIKFLDEYIVPDNLQLDSTKIGGLSGVDYVNDIYYLVVDDSKNPRFLTAEIHIKNRKIDTVNFTKVVKLQKDTSVFYKNNYLDLESIIYDKTEQKVILTSEGAINHGKNPSIFQTTLSGQFVKEFEIPKRFLASSQSKPRHNGTFEGLSFSFDQKGFWVANELPLEIDGEEPSNKKNSYPIRIVYLDKQTFLPIKEFAYHLDPIKRPLKGKVNINGLTDILEYKKNHFFIIERTFQSGYKKPNIVKIFNVKLTTHSTNTIEINSLNQSKYIPLEKELIFDFTSIQDQLMNGIIDNIEGITFGQKLPNGNQSIILVSDDNFQKFGKQLNQFILLELKASALKD